MTVSTSGALLSSLVFKLKNAPGDAEGFLLGEVQRHSVAKITDSQSSGTLEEKRTFIQSFMCFQEKYSFYDHYGRPDFEKIETLLGNQLKYVIGWFSYRRNSSHRISLREKAIHRRLMEGLPHGQSRAKEFLFALVTEQTLQQSPVHSTLEKSPVHSTEHSFFQWIGTLPQLVQVNVVNLRASAAVPYHTLSITHLPSSLQHYSRVLRERKSDFVDSEGYMVQARAAESLYRAMIARLEPLRSELSRTRDEVVSVGSEVSRLQEEINRLQEESEGEAEGGREDTEIVIGNTSTDDLLGLEPADEHALLVQPMETVKPVQQALLVQPTETIKPVQQALLVQPTETVKPVQQALLVQPTETVEPVQIGILVDITDEGEEQPPPVNQEDTTPPDRDRDPEGITGLVIANPMEVAEDGVLISLAEEGEGQERSSGVDSFPQGSQELF